MPPVYYTVVNLVVPPAYAFPARSLTFLETLRICAVAPARLLPGVIVTIVPAALTVTVVVIIAPVVAFIRTKLPVVARLFWMASLNVTVGATETATPVAALSGLNVAVGGVVSVVPSGPLVNQLVPVAAT